MTSRLPARSQRILVETLALWTPANVGDPSIDLQEGSPLPLVGIPPTSPNVGTEVLVWRGRIPKLIMNRFATLFPFLIRVSPLRWQQVLGTGSAILAAFLALAGAAWSLDLTDLLSFNLLVAIYWLFVYLSIYIEIRLGGGYLKERRHGFSQRWKPL